MEKDFSIAELYDIYGELLTKRQRELFESYYLYDLSLTEIAEPEGKSRQSVFDAVKKVKEKLVFYEQTLGIKKTKDALNKLANSAKYKGIEEQIKKIIDR